MREWRKEGMAFVWVLLMGQAVYLVLSHLNQFPIAIATNDHKSSGLNRTNSVLCSSRDQRFEISLVSSVKVLAGWRPGGSESRIQLPFQASGDFLHPWVLAASSILKFSSTDSSLPLPSLCVSSFSSPPSQISDCALASSPYSHYPSCLPAIWTIQENLPISRSLI